MIIFVDIEGGSKKILRLVVATIVSGAFLAVLAVARPLRRADDQYLACTSCFLITCCFVSGIVVHICDAVDDTTCQEYLGLGLNWYSTTVFLITLSISMAAAALLAFLNRVLTALSSPTFRMTSSGRPPVLELSRSHHFHAFISHAWCTGQDQVNYPAPPALVSQQIRAVASLLPLH
jgi:hypothetical protein